MTSVPITARAPSAHLYISGVIVTEKALVHTHVLPFKAEAASAQEYAPFALATGLRQSPEASS